MESIQAKHKVEGSVAKRQMFGVRSTDGSVCCCMGTQVFTGAGQDRFIVIESHDTGGRYAAPGQRSPNLALSRYLGIRRRSVF